MLTVTYYQIMYWPAFEEDTVRRDRYVSRNARDRRSLLSGRVMLMVQSQRYFCTGFNRIFSKGYMSENLKHGPFETYITPIMSKNNDLLL